MIFQFVKTDCPGCVACTAAADTASAPNSDKANNFIGPSLRSASANECSSSFRNHTRLRLRALLRIIEFWGSIDSGSDRRNHDAQNLGASHLVECAKGALVLRRT